YSGSGTLDGSYIHEDMSVDEAVRAARDQLSGGVGRDNDRSLDTLYASLNDNRDWPLEGPEWTGSRLTLVGIDRDAEQRASPISAFIDHARAPGHALDGRDQQLVASWVGEGTHRSCLLGEVRHFNVHSSTPHRPRVFRDRCGHRGSRGRTHNLR
ncbi:MAG: hypothetical protein ACI9MC_003714, partial [Kiritimatiellia bacterium]